MAAFYKLFIKAHIAFCIMLFFFAFAMAAETASAASESSAFTIQNVKVDVTAKSAAVAREQAFGEAQQVAFQKLTERLLSEEEASFFQMPGLEVISTMIQDFEITEEQLSSVRYVGVYTFRFKNDAVRNYLSNYGLSYSDVRGKPVLLLPYYQQDSHPLLWGENNPWMTAWSRSESYQGLLPVMVPIGDLQDVSGIGNNDALTYDKDAMRKMLARYGAGEAVIVLAIPGWYDGSSVTGAPDELSVIIYRTDRNVPEFANSLKIIAKDDAANDVSGSQLFDQAVKQVRQTLQRDWKSRTLVDSMQNHSLKVRVRFKTMNEWMETQTKLNRVQGVQNINLLSLTPRESHVELIFRGTEQRLRLTLAQADMTLTTPHINFADFYTQAPRNTPNNQTSPLVYDLYLNKFRQK